MLGRTFSGAVTVKMARSRWGIRADYTQLIASFLTCLNSTTALFSASKSAVS
jgi:hypothetical protein